MTTCVWPNRMSDNVMSLQIAMFSFTEYFTGIQWYESFPFAPGIMGCCYLEVRVWSLPTGQCDVMCVTLWMCDILFVGPNRRHISCVPVNSISYQVRHISQNDLTWSSGVWMGLMLPSWHLHVIHHSQVPWLNSTCIFLGFLNLNYLFQRIQL